MCLSSFGSWKEDQLTETSITGRVTWQIRSRLISEEGTVLRVIHGEKLLRLWTVARLGKKAVTHQQGQEVTRKRGKDPTGKGKGLLDWTIEELFRSLLYSLQIIIRNLSTILKFCYNY